MLCLDGIPRKMETITIIYFSSDVLIILDALSSCPGLVIGDSDNEVWV